jgi:hypothetical protein
LPLLPVTEHEKGLLVRAARDAVEAEQWGNSAAVALAQQSIDETVAAAFARCR